MDGALADNAGWSGSDAGTPDGGTGEAGGAAGQARARSERQLLDRLSDRRDGQGRQSLSAARAIVLLRALGEDPETAVRRARPSSQASAAGMRFFRTPLKASFHRKIETMLSDRDLYAAALDKDGAEVAALRDRPGFEEAARRLLCGVGLLRPLFGARTPCEAPGDAKGDAGGDAGAGAGDGRTRRERAGPFQRTGAGSQTPSPATPSPERASPVGPDGPAREPAHGAAPRGAAPDDLAADDALWASVALECLDDLGLGEGVVAADLRQRRLLGYLRSVEARRQLTREKPGRLDVMRLAFERIGGNGGRQAVVDLARRRLRAVGLDLGAPGAPGPRPGEARPSRPSRPSRSGERPARRGFFGS